MVVVGCFLILFMAVVTFVALWLLWRSRRKASGKLAPEEVCDDVERYCPPNATDIDTAEALSDSLKTNPFFEGAKKEIAEWGEKESIQVDFVQQPSEIVDPDEISLRSAPAVVCGEWPCKSKFARLPSEQKPAVAPVDGEIADKLIQRLQSKDVDTFSLQTIESFYADARTQQGGLDYSKDGQLVTDPFVRKLSESLPEADLTPRLTRSPTLRERSQSPVAS